MASSNYIHSRYQTSTTHVLLVGVHNLPIGLMWFLLAQSVRSRTMNLFNWLYWSSAFESDPELSVRKLHILWGWELLELGLRQMQAAISPLTPGSPGSDLSPVIRPNCIYSVKCAEAAWNYKSGRHSAL